ncbi:MAG TPA: AAA family ATPase [Dehalococcoidia bacterium]|nr:AAA family ATPase [Dehalococcoidia bacterium]
MTDPEAPAIILITGIPGAGKTTVARALAARFPRGVHIEGDALQDMIVSGRVWPEPPEPRGEAASQLALRYRNEALLARSFFDAGFTVVLEDIVIGAWLDIHREAFAGLPWHLVVLAPHIEAVKSRNAGRDKDVFETWGYLDRDLRAQMHGIGLWIDSTAQTVKETVDEILSLIRSP